MLSFYHMLPGLYKSWSCCMHKIVCILNFWTLIDRSPGNQKSLQIRPIRHIRLDILNIYVTVTLCEKNFTALHSQGLLQEEESHRFCGGLDFEATF